MADKTMKLEIMSPDRNFYTGEVTMAEFNTTEGYIGVYPEHIPLAVILSPGFLLYMNRVAKRRRHYIPDLQK